MARLREKRIKERRRAWKVALMSSQPSEREREAARRPGFRRGPGG